MRTSLWIALLLLAVMIGGGIASGNAVKSQSDRYISAAMELEALVEEDKWARAQEIAAAYLKTWEDTVPWLQMIIDHEDIDAVSLALEHLIAGLGQKEKASCLMICAELREHAHHLYHRDAMTLSNIL